MKTNFDSNKYYFFGFCHYAAEGRSALTFTITLLYIERKRQTRTQIRCEIFCFVQSLTDHSHVQSQLAA